MIGFHVLKQDAKSHQNACKIIALASFTEDLKMGNMELHFYVFCVSLTKLHSDAVLPSVIVSTIQDIKKMNLSAIVCKVHLLSDVVPVKSKGKTSQNFVAFTMRKSLLS